MFVLLDLSSGWVIRHSSRKLLHILTQKTKSKKQVSDSTNETFSQETTAIFSFLFFYFFRPFSLTSQQLIRRSATFSTFTWLRPDGALGPLVAMEARQTRPVWKEKDLLWRPSQQAAHLCIVWIKCRNLTTAEGKHAAVCWRTNWGDPEPKGRLSFIPTSGVKISNNESL